MNENGRVLPVAASAALSARPEPAIVERPSEQPAPVQAERLAIEEGPQPGVFVYKALDPVTGEVIRQLPREELLRLMRDGGSVLAGTLIDTRA
ncbi:flagellar protein FlaG [Brevundimonas sp.]|uniref:flagellar protein FlaG n=1 Tax=Brevundimonas sp. TaxID=1871086 RepID=UPI0022C8BB8E|nr:flagellar protein FlaG [Brevundimonas sp.]MCZ8194385.1 flagellar protein FlaG [Brevundimonas sp.]